MDSAAVLRPKLILHRRPLNRSARGRPSAQGRSRHHDAKQACRRRTVVQASTRPSGKSHSGEAIIIPQNYAQLLGLRGREMYLEPQVGAAYEELFHEPLEEGYSNVAKLGKEKLLYAAREGLRAVRGRVSLVPADTSIEPVLLAGALALLEQVGEYQLVLELAEQAQHLGAAALRSANKETLRDFDRDCILATALAHCGLAREAFDAGQVGPGCARMEEALRLLRSEGGGSPALGLLGQGVPPLAPKLQADIAEGLLELRAEVLLGYLQEAPGSEATLAKRKQAVASLRSMVQLPVPEQGGANGATAEAGPGEYLRRAIPCLTSFEIVELLDWERVAGNKAAFGWYYPGLLESAAMAHIVAGFTQRRPALIETAMKLLRAVRMESDVAVELAVCEVLLGAPDLALTQLKEDERIGAALSAQAGVPLSTGAGLGDFPTRDGVMTFIRRQSPEGDLDLLPGLVLFVERWLQRIAFPRLRDTAQLPPQASLVAFFQDPQVEKFLERRDGRGTSPVVQLAQSAMRGSGMAVATLGRLLVGLLSLPARGLHHLQLIGALQPLRWVAAAALLGAAAVAAGQALQGPRRQLTAMASAPVITVPTPPAQQQQQQQAMPQTAQQQQQQQAAEQVTLSRATAEQVVKQWLRTKADAMGPRHNLKPLPSVLAEPMLRQVRAEVTEAQVAGWFWNIRPLGVKVESVDCSNLGPGESGGYAVVLATVDESADLWATNGKKGDSYKTTYRVEYTVVPSKGAWKIASALVLGQ